tara:strand:- start:338 stop:514 length:177 start_codon:yes stop_codon:yes gene_type:complete
MSNSKLGVMKLSGQNLSPQWKLIIFKVWKILLSLKLLMKRGALAIEYFGYNAGKHFVP